MNVRSLVTLSLTLLLLTTARAGAVTPAPGIPAAQDSASRTYSTFRPGSPAPTDPPPGGAADTCATAAFQTLGQAWRVGFSTGGFLPDVRNLHGSGSVGAPQMRPGTAPGSRGVFPKLSAALPAPLSTPVHVVVIDNFNAVPVTLDVAAPGKSGRTTTITIPHGNVVLYHLTQLLRSDGLTTRDGVTYVRVNGAGTVTRTVVLHVVSIEPSGEVTSDIVTKLKTLFGREGMERAGGNVVVNMSLALMPCTVLQDYVARARNVTNRHYTLNEFFEDTAPHAGPVTTASERDRYAREVLQGRIPDTEPLLTYLAQQQAALSRAGFRLTLVASSGNFGLNIATMPAALPLQGRPRLPLKVIGVGATTWSGTPPGIPGLKDDAAWSDRGDVTSVGEWFSLPTRFLNTVCRYAATPQCDTRAWTAPAYRGTSFSAPSITALIASRVNFPGRCISQGSTSLGTAKNLNALVDGRALCIP